MVEFKEMERVIADLETKAESFNDVVNEAKEVLEMLREQYRSESGSGEIDISKLILDRADELKECCEYDSECLLAEEGKEDIVLLSNLSKRKIKTKDILLCIKIDCDESSSRIYFCTDRVVLCTGDEEGNNMDIFQNVPYDAISDIEIEVDGDDAWFWIITKEAAKKAAEKAAEKAATVSKKRIISWGTYREERKQEQIEGWECHQHLFEVIRTLLWDCHEVLMS